jgi:pilus assembly protein CpaB
MDRVDVISTVVDDSHDEGKKFHVSRTILSNVPVLAIDQSVDDKRKDEKPKDEQSANESKAKATLVGKTATLEVDPMQAEILAAGEAMGTLSLALRAVADNAELAPVRVQQRANPTVTVLRGGRGEVRQERAVR